MTSYSVMVSGGTTRTTSTTMTSTTISGLTENTMYTISVSAVNTAGSGSSVEVTETTLLSGECVINSLLNWLMCRITCSIIMVLIPMDFASQIPPVLK